MKRLKPWTLPKYNFVIFLVSIAFSDVYFWLVLGSQYLFSPAPSKKGLAPRSCYNFPFPALSKKAWLLGVILMVFTSSLWLGLTASYIFIYKRPSSPTMLMILWRKKILSSLLYLYTSSNKIHNFYWICDFYGGGDGGRSFIRTHKRLYNIWADIIGNICTPFSILEEDSSTQKVFLNRTSSRSN